MLLAVTGCAPHRDPVDFVSVSVINAYAAPQKAQELLHTRPSEEVLEITIATAVDMIENARYMGRPDDIFCNPVYTRQDSGYPNITRVYRFAKMLNGKNVYYDLHKERNVAFPMYWSGISVTPALKNDSQYMALLRAASDNRPIYYQIYLPISDDFIQRDNTHFDLRVQLETIPLAFSSMFYVSEGGALTIPETALAQALYDAGYAPRAIKR